MAEEGEAVPSPAKRKSRKPQPIMPTMPVAMAMPLDFALPRVPLATVQPMGDQIPAGMAAPVAAVHTAAAFTPL